MIRKVTSAIVAIIMVMTLSSCDPRRDLSKKEIEKYLDMAIEQIYAMGFEKNQDKQVAAMFEILALCDGLEKTGMAVYNDVNWINLHLQKEQCEKIAYFIEYDKVRLEIWFKKKNGFVIVNITFVMYYADGMYVQETLYPRE